MEQQNKNEELDLVWLIRESYAKLIKVGNWCNDKYRRILRFGWKKKIILSLAMSIGIVLGIAHSYYDNYFTKYTMESLVFLKTTSADVCEDLLESLNLFCKKADYSKMSEMMNISVEDASKLKKVNSYFWIDDRHSGAPTEVDKKDRYLKDTSVVRIYDRLQIEIVTSDLKTVPVIKNGLVYYLSQNEEVKRNYESRRQMLQKMVVQYEAEAEVLDSLRKQEYFSDLNRKKTMQIDGPMIVSESNRQLFHDDIIKLKNKSFDCEIELQKKVSSVYFNRDFAITSSSPNVVIRSIIYGLFLTSIVFIILGFIHKRKSIMRYLKYDEIDD